MRFVVALSAGLLVSAFMGGEGFVLGFAVGYLFWEHRAAMERVGRLEQQLLSLIEEVRQYREVASGHLSEAEGGAETVEPVPSGQQTGVMHEPQLAEPEGEEKFAPGEAARPLESPARPAAPDRGAISPPDRRPAMPHPVWSFLDTVKVFVLGGNTLVRLGVVVLFFGFAFLVKYAADNDYFPIELRLAATGTAGIGLIGLGWRLRTSRRGFALALQGGGSAVLYLTTFAAFRLYTLLPSEAAFILLVVTTALCATLALLQNTQSLIILALLGGFFAPVLASTGEGSHVVLFGYYVVLNAAILVLAWFRAWRPLHLVGFFCTFGIAGFWVADRYVADMFASTEPFLILFFLSYFAISILHARHEAPNVKRAVDGTLVFGLPVVVFSLQASLVQGFEYGLAWSALAFGSFYAIAAMVLYRRAPGVLRVLVESFAGIGLVLGTMVLPFSLDATWTGTGWALEGAALVWLGYRQSRERLRAAGMVLHLAACISFLVGVDALQVELIPVLNRFACGALVLSLSAGFIGFLVQRHRSETRIWEAPAEGVFLLIGIIWWLAAGIGEINRLTDTVPGYHLIVMYVTATALLCMVLRNRLDWQALRIPALLLLPALVSFLPIELLLVEHPFEAVGWIAWPLGIVAHVLILRRLEAEAPHQAAQWLHAGGLWVGTFLLTWESGWIGSELAAAGTVWPVLGFGLVPVLIAFLVIHLTQTDAWPFGVWRSEYLVAGVGPLLVAVWYWSMYMSFTAKADPVPLVYLPVLNPLDIVLGFSAVAATIWYRTSRPYLMNRSPFRVGLLLAWVLSGSAFVWLNATLARSVHFWADVPYDVQALLASTAFQTTISITWTVLSVTTMAVAARRGGRVPWLAGAALLGVVVVKLFIVDLSSINTVARIVSFIVVGLLLLLVGYLAPVPPRTGSHRDVVPPEEPAQASA